MVERYLVQAPILHQTPLLLAVEVLQPPLRRVKLFVKPAQAFWQGTEARACDNSSMSAAAA